MTQEEATLLEILVKFWPIISAFGVFVIGIFVLAWRMHTRTKINERLIKVHQEEDKEIHDALRQTIDTTNKMTLQIHERFDDVLNKVHETHMDVSESINKQNSDIKILKSRVDRLGGNVADLKISIENNQEDKN